MFFPYFPTSLFDTSTLSIQGINAIMGIPGELSPIPVKLQNAGMEIQYATPRSLMLSEQEP
jgi:hypothetical protein